MVQYEFKISGRVQGVGFRYYTKKQAEMLGITGWVKNTYDGSVLVNAQGNETDLTTFLGYLYVGPTFSKVENITKVKVPITEEFPGFKIRY